MMTLSKAPLNWMRSGWKFVPAGFFTSLAELLMTRRGLWKTSLPMFSSDMFRTSVGWTRAVRISRIELSV
jgi:hypothetical protein